LSERRYPTGRKPDIRTSPIDGKEYDVALMDENERRCVGLGRKAPGEGLTLSNPEVFGRDEDPTVPDIIPDFDEFDPDAPGDGIEPFDSFPEFYERQPVRIQANRRVVMSEVMRGIYEARAPLFQRGGRFVHPIRGAKIVNGITLNTGDPSIVEVPVARLETIIEACVKLQVLVPAKGKKPEEWKTLVASPPWLASKLRGDGQWSYLRELQGFVTWPILNASGVVVQDRGYDRRSGVICDPEITVDVPHEPSLDDAKQAYLTLRHFVRHFPFADEACASAWVALVMTFAARYAISRENGKIAPVPMFVIDASAKGSGKSLLGELAHYIVLGSRPSPQGIPEKDEEVRKTALTWALSGSSCVFLDNVTGKFKSKTLDQIITSASFQDRILGKSELATVSLPAVFVMTSNNVTLSPDLIRRSVHIRLVPNTDRPDLRKFPDQNINQEVHERRAELLRAALTILRAYHVAGCPNTIGEVLGQPSALEAASDVMGSFEHWVSIVAQPLRWIGAPDPILTQITLREGADDDAEQREALLQALKNYPEFTITELVEWIKATDDYSGEPSNPEVRAACESALGLDLKKMPTLAVVSRRIGQFRDSIAGSLTLRSRMLEGKTKWAVVELKK
jgi:hypothetical protein